MGHVPHVIEFHNYIALYINCNTPYSSSKLNESGILNRQSGGEKLKYILKFYIGSTCHVISRMSNNDLALCLWAHDVWGTISRNPLEMETWVQWTTNRKWPIGIRMVTWLMTSRDPERSRSWPQYALCQVSRKRMEIETWVQWTTNRKWLFSMCNCAVNWCDKLCFFAFILFRVDIKLLFARNLWYMQKFMAV